MLSLFSKVATQLDTLNDSKSGRSAYIYWNFLKVIGQHMEDAGLNVMWIESDLLGRRYYRTCNEKLDTYSQNHYSSNVTTASATTNELSPRTQRWSEAVPLESCSLRYKIRE